MKKKFLFLFILGIIQILLYENSLAQTGVKINSSSPWSSMNAFQTNVFVQNLGQFDSWAKTSDPVKYVVNNSDKIFFTQQGLTIKLESTKKLNKEDREAMEREEGNEAVPEIENYYVSMRWEGCNKNPALEVSEKAEGYYTFGEKGYEKVKAKGYRKLVYKELYPGIDVEYIIPDASTSLSMTGGIKYSLIIHPGADISKVKMKYTGDVDKMKISADGNIVIKTSAGDITDHAPQSFYKGTSEKIISAFELKGTIVSFKLKTLNLKPDTIVIDPWTTTPTSLTPDNAAFDIDYDNYGNVYVSGGATPHKLAKYSAGGSLIWTFTTPVAWGHNMYSKFCVLRNSGSVFISEGFSLTNPMVMKIDQSGNIAVTSSGFAGDHEIWIMFYHQCTGKLFGFGGGLANSNNLFQIADTNLTSCTVQNFNSSTDIANDIASVRMDNNGDFYAFLASGISLMNHLLKSPVSSGYNPPCVFDVNTGYNYEEDWNYGIPGFTGGTFFGTVRANVLALNTNYLFSYDGRNLTAWNKTNGTMLDSISVNNGYAAGVYRRHEGIDVDECNNVYVGGTNQVHVYSFNGTTFTTGVPLTSTITNEVYDVCLGPMNKLYVCGAGFVSELQLATVCPQNQISLTTSSTNGSCSASGTATVTATGGTSPYTYLWNPTGQTTSAVTGLSPGTYTVTVTDNSCIPKTQIDTVVVTSIGGFTVTSTQSNISCNGGSNGSSTASITGGTSPFTYNWSPSGGTNANATGLSSGTYTATVTDASGCIGTQIVSITQPTAITSTTTSTQASCGNNNGTVSVSASGGTGTLSYSWSPGGQTTTTATGLGAGTYTATITDANGCTNTQTSTITQPSSITSSATSIPTPCGSNNGTATAVGNGGVTPYTYNWSTTGQTTSTVTGLAAGNYTATVTDVSGCSSTTTVSVTSTGGPTASVSANVTITSGNSTILTATGGGTYTWNNSLNTSVITVSPAITTLYCVTVSNGICTDTACVTVYVEPMDCSTAGELYLPNAFSPNGDDENDVLKIYYGNMLCIKMFDLIIYNRWGEKVFETTDPTAGWDGTYKGKMESTAVFVYYMKATLTGGNEIVKKGNISLMR